MATDDSGDTTPSSHHIEKSARSEKESTECSESRSDCCDMCNDEDSDISEACCVCQSAPILYTLLPCRHACVCNSCIKLLEQCPMCRGYIMSYFRLDSRSEPAEENQELDLRPLTVWQAFNQRLNDMLGLA